MHTITKRVEISGAHFLDLPYKSKCQQLHGHNWIVDITISGELLSEHGMLMDFVHIKEIVNQVDHKLILTDRQVEEFMPAFLRGDPMNPVIKRSFIALPIKNTTAECMAAWIAATLNLTLARDDNSIGTVTKICIQESEGNVACFTP